MQDIKEMVTGLLLIYSKDELAHKAGIDRATVYRIINVKHKPSFWTYSKIESVYKVNKRRIAANKRHER